MKFFTNMFETWFKTKFDYKCKSNIKMALERIEMIKRRRKAMHKFLRSDIAQLLKLGLDSNAYGRVGRLYVDQKRTLCYDFVEQFCTLILNHLTTMKDQSECPEECREAVPSLMYAAARIADLPELRVLRSLFSERYGNSLESFVNKEFADLLKKDEPTEDMKIQLMQDIALEYGVDWDSKPIERKLHKLPSSDHNDWSQNADGDQESNTSHHENGWRISIQETGNEDVNNGTRDENNDEPNGELEKLTENVRKRISDYWSRTTSLLSTSRETTTSSEESSSESLSKRRPFFPFRLMPPHYVKNDHKKKEKSSETSLNSTRTKQKHDNKENQEVPDDPNIEIWADDEAAAPRGKNKRRKKGGPPPRAKSHSTECLPNPVETEAPRGHARSASYQPDSIVTRPPTHVHPKLPDYDDFIARFAALREKS